VTPPSRSAIVGGNLYTKTFFMIIKKTIGLLVFYLFTLQVSFSQTKIDFNLLVGKWKFVNFEWPNYVPDTAKIIKESNKNFKDAIYSFTKDKRLIITQSYTPKGYSNNLTYTIKDGKVYVLPVSKPKENPQILEIDFLDNTYLKFYVKGFPPVGTFKRISN